MPDLEKEVAAAFSTTADLGAVEQTLLEQGLLKEDVEEAIHKFTSKLTEDKTRKKVKESRKFVLKEIFDRIGYGLGSEQYINIFFMQSGATYALIALINSLKAILGSIASSFLKDYSLDKGIDKRMISYSGIFYGYCFILMAIAVYMHAPALFIAGLLAGALSMVAYGESYQEFIKQTLKGQKEGTIAFIYKYGIIITVVSLLLSSFLMDRYQLVTLSLPFVSGNPGWSFFSYLAIFEAAALFFILSGYVVSVIESDHAHTNFMGELLEHVPIYYFRLRSDISLILSSRPLFMLIVATSLTGFIQLLGNSFYGIYVYKTFSTQGFGGFLNVAMISILALITSLVTPLITKENAKEYGKYPMLIFGTVLMSIMPLAFYLNPNIVSIGMGTILGVMGAAIVGIANGMLYGDLVPPDMKTDFFTINTIVVIIPYIILGPLGAYLVGLLGLGHLFLLLAISLIVLVVPIYFIMMLSPSITQDNKL